MKNETLLDLADNCPKAKSSEKDGRIGQEGDRGKKIQNRNGPHFQKSLHSLDKLKSIAHVIFGLAQMCTAQFIKSRFACAYVLHPCATPSCLPSSSAVRVKTMS